MAIILEPIQHIQRFQNADRTDELPMREYTRADRLSAQILKNLALILDEELADLGVGMVTFTDAALTRDLRQVTVYYSFFGNEESKVWIAGYLERERKRIRSAVGRTLRIRHIPDLIFAYDTSVERGMRVEQLLKDLKKNDDD